MPGGSASNEVKEVLDETFKEAVKDLLVNRPFARAERLDSVSSAILGTVGMVLTLYVGIASWILQNPTTYLVKVFIPFPCAVLILSVISLTLAVRSREIVAPSEISLESYFDFLKELSKVNNKKKRLQDIGLMFFIFGIVLMATSFILWIF
jgi:hypothetical protein